MKRILSFVLVLCMLLSVAPMSIMAQTADATASLGNATYEAKLGETISVPFVITPAAEMAVGTIFATILLPEGLQIALESGAVDVSEDAGAVSKFDDAILMVSESAITVPVAGTTLFTLKCSAEKAGSYELDFDGVELMDKNGAMLASSFDGNLAEVNAKLTFKADASAGDADFDKFKAKGVYYDVSEDADFTGNVDTGIKMNVQSNYRIYDTATEEGLAAFKADANYATLGSKVETAMSNKKTTKASYTDKDSAYHFVDAFEGKPAMYGTNNVATQFVGNWKECLGAPNMYWMTVKDYFKSTDTDATFVVQYYDNTGSFNIRYSKQGDGANAFTVTKEGTNAWVTKAFHVTDAMLNTGLTATGLIDNKHTGRFESGSDTYISKFAILKTEDYNEIMGIVPEIPPVDEPGDLPEDPAGEDACDFIKNSTYYGGEQFEYADVAAAGTDVIEAGIEGLTVVRGGTGSEGTYTKIVADPASEDDYSLAVHHPGQNWVEGATHINQEVKETLDIDVGTDYIVMSHKFWYPAGAYIRLYPTFTFKKYSDGSTITGTGFSSIINGNVNQEDLSGGYALAPSADKWAEWDFVIDAKDLKADLYIDHQYAYTFDFTQGANNKKPSKADYYISGVKDYTLRFDRFSKVGTAYFDDIQVRAMTAEQYAAAFANETVNVEGTSITTADTLPVKTAGYGLPVTWTTNNEDVTVDANGAISVADATVTYEDVVFTASFAGNTKTFTLDVKKQPKYAEYTFGAKEDKAYGMTSFNVADNYYTQTKDGLTIRNSIVKFDEQRTLYYIVDDPTATSDTAASHEVSKEEYDAFTGLKKSYNVVYYNTSAQTGDSAMNRYDAVGPDGDKRAAAWGVGHLRNAGRLSKRWTNSMIHFDTGSTFSATDNALVIEVDVLDVGTHAVNLQYCNNAGTVGSVNSAPLTNSGEWVTLKFELTDADFAWTKNTGLGNNKQDMRFQLGQPTYISAIRIYDVEPVEIADADYAKIAVADYDVMINEDNTITAKTAITAEEAADAKLYVAYYNAKGNLVGVATSAQVTDGVAQTLVTGKSVGATYNTVDYTLKTFVWDADLKPLR